MPKSERMLIVFMGLLSVGFATAAAVGFYQQHREKVRAMQAQVLPVAPSEVIGPNADFAGDPHSTYTLVEFGDYQCPPCHAANEKIPDILKKYRGKVRFTFRNLPLTSIHPYAMPAALAAEVARQQGQFWSVHDHLYRIDPEVFDAVAIRSALVAQRKEQHQSATLRKSLAESVIELDMREARALGLKSTPSFFLCCPNRQVVHLKSLNQIANYVSL